ncbi:Exosome complex component RRP45-like, partial [Homarus americanus]
KTSIVSAIRAGQRYDNREFLEVRDISLNFGKDYGSCTVTLGQTRVLAQVTGEVVEPRPSRPNEGKISISVHLSPMAAPHFESGRSNDLVDELQQILERNIKESRCLDLESLCVLAEESVWQLRVDVTVLNHAGNLGDACNLASVAALRHFHRPDVTVEEDGRVTIHTLEEREPIPTFMKKVPVCLTYAFFVVDDKCYMLMDPSEKEERRTGPQPNVSHSQHDSA